MIKEQEEIENREIDPIEKELNGHEQKYGIRPIFLIKADPDSMLEMKKNGSII